MAIPPPGQGLGEIYNVLIQHGIRKPDWDPAFREVNKSYDQILRVLKLRIPAERQKAFIELEQVWKATRGSFTPHGIDSEFSAIDSWTHTPEYRERSQTVDWLRQSLMALPNSSEPGATVDKETEAAAMRLAGRAAAVMLQPVYVRALIAAERARQSANNLHIALALAEYAVQHRACPTELSALTPEFTKEIPADVFTGQQSVYRRTSDGYVLYSLGENRKDDQDRNRHTDVDDLVVRMLTTK